MFVLKAVINRHIIIMGRTERTLNILLYSACNIQFCIFEILKSAQLKLKAKRCISLVIGSIIECIDVKVADIVVN
jgi:hypothetical protein